MKSYMQMSREELLSLKASLEEEFKTEEAKGLSLNMARGKPGASQLALSMPMLDVINSKSDMKTLLGNVPETMVTGMESESAASC